MISSKKGKIYVRFVLALAVVAAAIFAYNAIASAPTATPVIVNTNGTTIDGVQIANASIARATDQLFFYSNFSSENASLEVNSTFKWLINNTNQSWGWGNRTTDLVPMIYRDAVAYWHLDENGGTSGYADSSGQGNTGVPNNGINNVSGIILGAVKLDGVDDFVSVADSNSLDFRTDDNFTIAAWINVNDSVSSKTIVEKWDANGDQRSFAFWINGGNRLTVRKTSTGTAGTGSQANSNTITISANTWHHAAVAKSGTTLNFYFDGAAVGSPTLSGAWFAGTAPLAIGNGSEPGDHGGQFNGSIDEVAIYNRTLTASEIKQLHLRTWYDNSPQQFLLHPNYPEEVDNSTQNTTLLLHFNDGTGTTAADSSIYGNSGGLRGTAYFTNDSISSSAVAFTGGISDNVNVSFSQTLNITTNLTVSAWVKYYADPGGQSVIVGKWGGGAENKSYMLQTYTNGQVGFNVKSSAPELTSGTNVVQVGKWFHIAGVIAGSNASLYVNGLLKDTDKFTAPNTIGTSQVLIGGDNSEWTLGEINGVIDEVKIVNRSFTAAEIAAEYRKGCPFCSSDGELPTTTSGVVWQPGRFVENLSVTNASVYLRFDEGTGQNVSDISNGLVGFLGLDANAAANDPTWTNDSVGGYALKFNGTAGLGSNTQHVNMSNIGNITSNLTIEAWVKVYDNGNTKPIVLRGNSSLSGVAYSFYIASDETLDFQIDNSTVAETTLDGPAVSTGVWHHVAAVYLPSTRMEIYLDGVLSASTTTSVPAAMGSDGDSFLYISWQANNDGFNGTIDEVRILNRSLSAAEVLADYRKAAKGLGLLSNDYLNYSATNNFNEREGTVEFWVKPEWNGNDNLAHVLFDTENAADFNITKTTSNDLAVYFGNPGSAVAKTSISGWTSGNWRHVAVEWNNYTSNVTLHVDGSQVNNSGTAFAIPAAAATKSFLIGARAPGTSDWANATFSEFRISRKTLTAQEISLSFGKGRQYYSNEYMLNGSNFGVGDALKVEYAPADSEGATGTALNSTATAIMPLQCGALDAANTYYDMSEGLSATGTCFTVAADSVTLDCHGYNVTYATSVSGAAIDVSGYNSTTVKNCIFLEQAATTGSPAINVTRSNSSIFSNNSINTTGNYSYAIQLQRSNFTNISSNFINTTANFSYGISLLTSAWNNLTSNTISTKGRSGNTYGINITRSPNSLLQSNTISTGTTGTGGNNYGIYFLGSNGSSAAGNTVNTTGTTNNYGILFNSSSGTATSNTVNTSGTSTGNYGFYLESSSTVNITGNTVYTFGTGSDTGFLLSGSSRNNLTANTVNVTSSSDAHGVFFFGDSDYNLLDGNRINVSNANGYGVYFDDTGSVDPQFNNVLNNIIRSDGADGVRVDQTSINRNNFTSNTVTTAGNGFYIRSGADNTVIQNNIISAGVDYGILLEISDSDTITNNTILSASTAGIYITLGSIQNNVSDNYINLTGSSSIGIYVFGDSDSNSIYENRINTTGSSGYGIFLEDSSTSDPDSNKLIRNNIMTTGTTAHGIYVEKDAENTIVSGNVINTTSTGQGIRVERNFRNNITGNNVTTSINDTFGIYILNANNSNYTDNIIRTFGNRSFAVQIDNTTTNFAFNNTFTNNVFNTTALAVNVTHPDSGYYNNFSLSAITAGTNIVGGSNLGGNFYDNSTAGGEKAYSFTCTDADGNGICDSSLTHATNNVDFFPLAAAVTCGSLDTADKTYTVSSALSATGTCFTVAANNVTLDCNGFTVTYATSSAGSGIDVQGYNATTVKNCIFLETAATTGSPAINATRSNNSIFGNNTINTTGTFSPAIKIVTSNFTNISSNTINTTANNAEAINMTTSGSNNATQNTIRTQGTLGAGINLGSSSNNNFLQSNTINTIGSTAYGIFIQHSNRNVVERTTINVTGTQAIYIFGESDYNIINENVINTSGSDADGIRLDDTGTSDPDFNNITKNVITDSVGSFASAHGINIISDTGDTHVEGNNITNTGATAIAQRGIEVGGTATIIGNIISGQEQGIQASNLVAGAGTVMVNITRNNVSVSGNDAALTISGSDGVYAFENNMSSSTGSAVLISGATPNFNYIIGNNLRSGANSATDAFTLSSGAQSNVIERNVITATGTGDAVRIADHQNNFTGNNITASGLNSVGIIVTNAARNNFTGNVVKTTGGGDSFGVQIDNTTNNVAINNIFYNNVFNTTVRHVNVTKPDNINNFSLSAITAGTNIVGGSNLGGNFYDNSTAGGQKAYSFTCADADGNGICDSSLSHATNNVDFFPLAAAVTCGSLDTADKTYTVSGALSATGTCFTVAANNVTLDCNGFTVTYATSSAGSGIDVQGYNATTVRNCIFLETAATTGSPAINATRSNNSIFSNNTINTTGNYSYAIQIQRSNFTNISSNAINTTGNFSYGLSTVDSAWNNLTQNTISTKGRSGSTFGVNVTRSPNNLLQGNTITTGITGVGSDNYGIIFASSISGNATSNTINTSGTSGSNYGIYFVSSSSLGTATGNTVNTTGTTNNYGIIFSSSANGTATSNTINTRGTTTSNVGIFFTTSGSGNGTAISNIIRTSGTSSNYGIYFSGSSSGAATGNTVNTSGTSTNYGIFFDSSTSGNATSNTINTSGTSNNYGIYFSSASSGTVTSNIIRTSGTSATNIGIRFDGSTSGNVTSNTISTGGTTDNYGIYISASSTSGTATSNTINTSGTSSNRGIVFANSVSGKANSNTINTSGTGATNYGIQFSSSNSGTATSNTVKTSGTDSNYGIYFTSSTSGNATDNTIRTSGTDASNYGIFFSSSGSGTATGNIVNISGTTNQYVIWLSGSSNNAVTENTLNGSATNDAIGIYMSGSSTNNVTGNTIKTSGSAGSATGIFLDSTSNGNVFTLNTINTSATTTGHGIGFTNSLRNNVTANNITTSANNSFGIHILTSNLTNFTDNIVKTTGNLSFAVQIETVSANNSLRNNIFNSTALHVNITNTANANNFSLSAITAGTNIVGGSNLGGNFYDNSTVGGQKAYSFTCTDANGDGICDSSLSHATNNVDFFPLAAAVTCGSLDTADKTYAMSQALTATGTCFTVAATNVTLDCNGFTVTYATSSAGSGIDVSGYNATTVKNCIFLETAATTGSPAINVTRSNNSIFLNNSINTTGNFSYGIELKNSNFTNISSNTINTTGNRSYGIGTADSALINLTQNTVRTAGTSGSTYGVNITRSPNSLLQGNTVTTGTAGAGASNYGIYFLSSTSGTASSNTVNTSGTSTNYGIYLLTSSTSTVTSNTVNTSGTSSSNYGIEFSSSGSGTVNSNTITTSGTSGASFGIYFSSSSSGTATSNTIRTSGTVDNYGIAFDTGSSSVTVTSNTINTSGTSTRNYGIYLFDNTDNNNITGNFINTSTATSHGIFLEDSIGDDPDFNNVTENTILTTGATSHGIYVETDAENTIVKGNVINTTSTGNGIQVEANVNNNITGNNVTTSAANAFGIYVLNARSSNYIDNIIKTTGSNAFGVQIDNTTTSLATSNTFRNNIFNTTALAINITRPYSGARFNNFSLTAITAGTNIVGGSNLGGNFYDNSTAGGQKAYSFTCTDADGNGICDSSLTHATNNVDFFPLAAAVSCGALDTADKTYTVSSALSATGTCFTVAANNVTLDCNGFSVTYATSSAGSGIDVQGYNSTTVKNCIFLETAATANSPAINATRSNNSIFGNNTINTTGNYSFAVFALNSNFTNVSSNVINTSGNASGGVVSQSSGFSNLTGNRFRVLSGNSINITSSDYDYVQGNVMNRTLIISGSQGTTATANSFTTSGITVQLGSNYSIITGNNITNTGTGLTISASKGTNASFNNVTSTAADVTTVSVSASPDTYLFGNNISNRGSSSGSGFGTCGTSQYTTLVGVALAIAANTNGTNITGNRISVAASFEAGIRVITSNGTQIVNNQILADTSGDGPGIYLLNYAVGTNITGNFINVDGSSIAPINLFCGINRTTITRNSVVEFSTSGATGLVITESTTPSSDLTVISENNFTKRTAGNSVINVNTRANITNNSISSSGTNSVGITVSTTAYVFGNVINTTGAATSSGISVTGSNNNISQNTVNTSGTNSYGIRLSSGTNAVSGNTINTSNNDSYGIFVSSTLNNISQNVILTTGLRAGGIHAGIANNNKIFGNTINTTNLSAHGIFINGSLRINATGNNITTSNNESFGIRIFGSNSSNITDNIVNTLGNMSFGMQLEDTSNNIPANNSIYNNIFNTTALHVNVTNTANSNNFSLDAITSGTNIVGGSNLGGNFYDNSTAGGQKAYSFTCTDADGNGICDSSLTHATNNVDFFPLAAAVSCGALDTADRTYAMSGTLSATGTCFTVAATNVTLDCNGYSVTYATSSSGSGIDVQGYNATTVKNCIFLEQSATTGSPAINVTRSNNSIFSNNTINTTGNYSYAIQIQRSNFTNISSNTINTTANFSYGISLMTSAQNNLTSNTIRTLGTRAYGINLTSSSNNIISYHNITTTGSTAYGTYLLSNANYNLVDSNNISTTANAIQLDSTSPQYNTISNNKISSTSNSGIGSGSSSDADFTSIATNTILAGGSTAVTINNAQNVNITDNTITVTGTGQAAIYYINSASGLIKNNTIISAGYGVQFNANGAAANITNNTINTTGSDIYGIYLLQPSGNKFIDSNKINTTGSSAHGIFFQSTNGPSTLNKLTSNVILTRGTTAYGIYLQVGSNNNVIWNNVINTTSTGHGILVENNKDNNITGNNITTSAAAAFGIRILGTNYSNFTDNIITTRGTGSFAVQLENIPANNTFTNNIFNTTAQHVNVTNSANPNNFSLDAITAGTNIVGGSNLGGNFYDNSTVGGLAAWSLNCSDFDADGICDTSLTHATNNVDFFPLAGVSDVTPPNVSIITPADGTVVSGSFLVNASINDTYSNVDKVNLTVFNSTGNVTARIVMTRSAGTATSGYWNVTFDPSGLPEGRYNLSVNATDVRGNTNISANVSFITAVFPVFFNNNTNNTAPKINEVVGLSINWSDNVNLSFASLEHNITSGGALINTTVLMNATTFNVTFNMTVGVSGGLPIAFKFYGNDTSNNINSTAQRILAVANTVPNASIIFPADSATITTSNFSLNYSRSDPDTADTTTFYIHHNGVFNRTEAINTTMNLSDATYAFNVSAYDGTAFSANATITVLVDTVQPYSLTSCQDLTAAGSRYELAGSITSAGTCFTVAADNVTLDCARYTVTYATSSRGSGVNINGYNSTTVKNCIFLEQAATANSPAINATRSNNSIFSNNTINTTGNYSLGIELQQANFTNVSSNTINTTGNWSFGIGAAGSARINLTQNTVRTAGASGNTYGVNATASSNSLLQSNTIKTGTTGAGANNFGIYFFGSSSGTATSNTISTNGTSSNHGIHFAGSSSGNATDNTINISGTNSNYGILFDGSSSSGTATSNTISTSSTGSSIGIRFDSSSSGTATSNTISTSSTGTNYGILFLSSSSGTVTSNTVNTSGTSSTNVGIYVFGNSDNSKITSNTINMSGSSSHGIFLEDSGASDPDFNNVTNNVILTTGATSHGIYVEIDAENTIVEGNVINTTSTGQGIRVERNFRNNITANNVTTSANDTFGIYILNANSSNYTENIIKTFGNLSFAVQIDNTTTGLAFNNTFTNNIFNTTALAVNVTHPSSNYANNFSLSAITAGTNIVGRSNLGGNFYDNSTSGGLAAWSLNCTDAAADGICDTSLSHATNNVDFFPLAAADTIAPAFFNNDTNDTALSANKVAGLSINWSDDDAVNFTTLEHNFSGGALVNTTVGAGLSRTFNVTFNVTVTAVKGELVAFRFYGNDSSGNVNSTAQRTLTIVNAAPVCSWIYPTNNMLHYSGNISLGASCTDADADSLTYYWYVNASFNKTTSANTTINFTAGNYVANVSASDGSAFAANATITFDLTSNITLHATTLRNFTVHNENISAAFMDPDGASDIINYSIAATSGNCNQLQNTSSGNLRNFSFNCTGEALAEHTVTITVNDTRGNVSKAVLTNAYPDSDPSTPIIFFPPNNGYVTTANHSLNYSSFDLDGDPITYFIFLNTVFNKTETGNTTMNLSDGNYRVNVSAFAGPQFSATNRTVNYTVDTISPVINSIRLLSNSSFLYQQLNSTSGAKAYLNSRAGEGASQVISVEIGYTDTNPFSVSANLTFGDTVINSTQVVPTMLRYVIDEADGNESTLVTAMDRANRTGTAVINWTLDINDTVSVDSSAADYWNAWGNTTNVTINISSSDSLSGLNRTYYCIYNTGTAPCIPTLYAFLKENEKFDLTLNCSAPGTCQQAIRYYSMDNVSNNESIRETHPVYIRTGNVDISDSIANNSKFYNGSFVQRSNITNTTIQGACRVINSVVIRSTLIEDTSLRYNCTVEDSVLVDVNLTSSIVERYSFIDPSTIMDSVITNSSIHNSTVSFSRVENSVFCGNFTLWTGAILNNTLVDGRLEFNNSVYFGPMNLSSICGGIPSSPVGSLVAEPSIVNNSATLAFRYTAASTGYIVTISTVELQKLDNSSRTSITLNDNGLPPDAVANDAVYTANYSISLSNNQSDGNKTVVAQVFDGLGNNWTVRTNVTLDNTRPNASVVINNNDASTSSRIVTLQVGFNDTIGVKKCRFANEDRAFNEWEPCASAKVWGLSAVDGVKTVVLQVADNAENINETNDTITLAEAAGEIFGTLSVNDSVVNNGSSILFTFLGSALNLNVTINQTEMRKLDNTSGALQLNDSGVNGDYLADDVTYSGIYTISMLNNISDGMKRLVAEANNSAGSLFRPAVNITLDNTRPNASLSILGISPAGFQNISTEYTSTKAVTLMVGFNDTAGGTATSASGGVDRCRFANENQVFTDWEACQSVKSWLLSDGNGNKTVVAEVRDLAGNVNMTNDTIYLNVTGAGLDQTPPTRPTVLDDGTYTNIDSALHARWNATDYENELLHLPLEWEYRIAFDNSTKRINDTWQYAGVATEVTVYSLNLSNGTNYTFEVRAINTAGLRGDNGTSDGIIVDTVAPTAPSITSTHSQSAWSSGSSVTFNWSSNDTLSGVVAYSYLLDANATTIPDNVPEAENEHAGLAGAGGYNDGKSTIMKFNSTGNATAVFVEVKSNLSANDVVRVTLQLAEASTGSPDLMGFRVYVITAVPTSFAMNGSNVSLIVDTSIDVSFVSSLLDAASYTVDVPMSTSVTGSRFFVAVAGDVADDSNRHNLLLATSNTSMDASTQSYRCSESDSGCGNTTTSADYGIKAEIRDVKQDSIWDRSYTVADGTTYFHVKAKDAAGNWGDVTNYTILVDTSSPSTPQMTEPAKFTNTTQVVFNWTASTDSDSGIDNYSLQVDNNSDFSSPEFYAWVNNVTNYTVTGLTADATYNARVHSRNLAGVNSSWSSSVGTVVDTTAPVITFSKPSSTGVVASQDVALVLKTNEKAICTFSKSGTDPYRNFTFTNSTYHETKVSADSGSNSFSVQCKDTILNTYSTTMAFTVSTTATPSSITLQSLSVFTADVVKTDIIVTTSSSQRLGELSPSTFIVKLGDSAVDASVFDNGAGNYTLMFNAPERNGTYELKAEIGSASATSTLTVQALLFTVQYVQSGISSNAADRLIYFVAGNFTLGLATDSKSSSQQSTSSALNLTSDAKEGTAYIFVTRVSGNVERVESLLKDRTFLDVINPSFGYAIDRETFVVFTDLEYGDIALTGNKTLTTGRYNLIIENKGFDSTLNKTKLEVRVQ